ncbi:hypothetical protein AX15_006193 [Amanita polypyramis BW_CC]|nr:hypothetical protein AX15_006193 [Amanita polypyramis BW_CC]
MAQEDEVFTKRTDEEHASDQTSQPSYVSVPIPRCRHATPSGPWPFLDLHDSVPTECIERRPENGRCQHDEDVMDCNCCMEDYPQSLFPNWTQSQQEKSGIRAVKRLDHDCSLSYLEIPIDQSGELFSKPESIPIKGKNYQDAANELRRLRARKAKVRAIFVDGISGPALKMLGTIFDIEPFYFSSSLGWTPSRFQESLEPDLKRDHITVTLRFVRKVPKSEKDFTQTDEQLASQNAKIDVHKPLEIGDSVLKLDLLAIHMIRSKMDNTIISYHCSEMYGSTSATELRIRLQLVGQSVYWSKIFETYPDRTFVLVSILWYALYAWDEALQELHKKVNESEAQIMGTLDTYEMTRIMNDLHTIHAHMLYYTSLLADFRKVITFVKETSNPATEDAENKLEMQEAMDKECDHILHSINRLEKDCQTQDLRVGNAVYLGYSRLNIYDSKQATKLTEASLRDSAATKQISYLTMVFLPAIFTSVSISTSSVISKLDIHASLFLA